VANLEPEARLVERENPPHVVRFKRVGELMKAACAAASAWR
jgi:hypothetical protein